MQIDIKGRNVPVTDELRARMERRSSKISRQVSDLARMEVEIYEERNPSIADREVAEATLYLKGATLRARDASPEMDHSLKLVAIELARQVKRRRDKLGIAARPARPQSRPRCPPSRARRWASSWPAEPLPAVGLTGTPAWRCSRRPRRRWPKVSRARSTPRSSASSGSRPGPGGVALCPAGCDRGLQAAMLGASTWIRALWGPRSVAA